MMETQSFGLFSASWRALRPKTIDAADAVATHDRGATELKPSKQARINAMMAIAAKTYRIIRQNRIVFIALFE